MMLVSAPIVLGVYSYTRLGVDLLPNVDIPVVSVTTTVPGASVEEMESSVTKPIEEIVNTVSGIDELSSTTKEGQSRVTVQFVIEKDGAVAAQEVDSKIQTILKQLPQSTDRPIVDRFDLDASPVLTLAVSGRRDVREVTEIARKKVKEVIETLDGVGAVTLVGGQQRAINVVVDPIRLLKYDPPLSIEDVRLALVANNQEQPGGRVDQGTSEQFLRTMGRIERSEDFAKLIVANRRGQPIRIEDIGSVEDSVEEPRGLSRLWVKFLHADDRHPGDNAVSLIVRKKSGTNTVEVVDSVKSRLAELTQSLPPDIEVAVLRDQSRFIKASIHEVQIHLLFGAILVGASILLFLRDWRTTVIATLAIPTSIIGTFAFMYYMDFTLNNITMLALILSVGIVIDDAVVVHENIFRHMEEHGRSAREAAGTATREISLAVIATTLSLLVAFAPIVFMGGRVGRFFSSFGLVVGFSVLMSMIISFSMTPMLCSQFLRLDKRKSSKAGPIWHGIEHVYMAALSWSMRHRLLTMFVSLCVLATTPALFLIVGKDFIPKDDQSEFEVMISMPEGYSLERSDRVLRDIEIRLRRLPGVTYAFTVLGDTSGRAAKGQGEVTRASIYVRMIDLRERSYSQHEVMSLARDILADYPDLRCAVQEVTPFQATGFRQVDVDLTLVGPDMQRLAEISDQITDWMKRQGVYVDIDTSLSIRKPELRIRPNRDRMSDLGVSIQAVSATTNVLVGGVPVSTFKESEDRESQSQEVTAPTGEQYDVWLRAEKAARTDPDVIGAITVPSSKTASGLVQLANVVDFESAEGPNTIERFQRQRQIVISANLAGIDLSDGLAKISRHIDSLGLPPGYHYEFVGRAKSLAETMDNFVFAFILSFIFMYMILAAQFESLVHPISILAALPLTLPFAILSLILLGTNLDVYAMFGLFMLFGIVKKNGILQVDYTNHLRQGGMERLQAIHEANRTRLRPILMTTVMLVAAMIPMALGQGPGAGSRASMAKVILGGQALSLLLTLLVTPVAYSLLDDMGGFFRRIARRRNITADAEASRECGVSSPPDSRPESHAEPPRLQRNE